MRAVKREINSQITCNENNVCKCPSGYTWLSEGANATKKYGKCALSSTVCPDKIHYCKPHGATCNAQNECVCSKRSFFHARFASEPFVGYCISNDKSPTCVDGGTCISEDPNTKVACSRGNTCVCLGAGRYWLGDGDDVRAKPGTCVCQTGTLCGEVCCNDLRYTESGAGPRARECTTALKCAAGRAPCGHSSRDGVPSKSTTCCKKGETATHLHATSYNGRPSLPQVCVADENHVTSCAAEKTCPEGRAPCGGTAFNAFFDAGIYSIYFECTAHDRCCPRGTECDYMRSGKSRCTKPIECGTGETACGRYYREIYYRESEPSYYPAYVEQHPDNICCPDATRDCFDPTSGSSPVSKTVCVKKEP
ncbi:hypothetical protein JKP88DRAFT_295080 [Tribonema minus]|uniref:Uncharacterized protein n=1 Tax=Tribonema minus TaxID=303371 RepID=A0A835ZIE1_9STRA|nr:hypothetical protein JKP88DRAFT_295080 [Tribonema minus]